MDIFKFRNPTHPMKMEQGEIINGLTSKLWVERYSAPGEFTLVGDAEDGFREKLPLGTYISHIDTNEIMIVENHEINTSRDRAPEIKITGRSFTTLLEQRVSGANRAFPVTTGLSDAFVGTSQPYDQMVSFIKLRFIPGSLVNADDSIPWLTVATWITGGPAAPTRYFKLGSNALDAVQEALTAEGYAIATVRPGPWVSWPSVVVPDENTLISVYQGQDRSATAVFSYDLGESESTRYFWSTLMKKTMAIVSGRWVAVRVSTGETNQDRRMIYVDGTGIDQNFTNPPTGSDLTAIQNGMIKRGQDVLAHQKELNIADVTIPPDGTHLKYRTDYGVGDLVMVQGEYNTTAKFRVSEYVEIDDENGISGYPTLVVP